MEKKNGFTLIELIAVLVILAILALIVTPLVLNIIRKARTAADKRSIDAYGRSIEIAIAGYLLDNGTFPTSIGQLTIEYLGDEVVCSTTQLNGDSSVYLTGCTVGGRNVDYSYGTDMTPPAPTYTAYSVGDEVTYNNVDYYVIADSGTSEANLTLLKAEPLTVEEVNTYGIGHINKNTYDSVGTVYNNNGYGGMVYYSSETCGYVDNNWITDGCTNVYLQSDVKYVVDAWKNSKAPASLEARLLTYDEYYSTCVETEYQSTPSDISTKFVSKYEWMYNSNYWYWTMSPYTDSVLYVWRIYNDGKLYESSSGVDAFGSNGLIRPVITLSKSALD